MSSLVRERESVASGAYTRRLRLEVLAAGQGEASVSLPVHDAVINRSGRVHGGAIASGMLTAGRLAAAASERETTTRLITCCHSHVAFLDIPADAAVVSRARVLRRGRDVAHVAAKSLAADGSEIARSSLTFAFVEQAAAFGDTDAARGVPCADPGDDSSMSASPYLSAAGVTRLESEGGVARLRVPYAINAASSPARVDDGAIAGLVDSCAAFAAYLDAGIDLGRTGVTVSMSINVLAASEEDLVGRAWVTARAGDSCISRIEVSGAATGRGVASGSAVYRIFKER